MLDTIRWQVLLVALAGWVNRHQREVIAYLREENRVLTEQIGGRRLRFTDPQRRRLTVTGHCLGRRVLTEVATLVTPDTLLRWHRQLIARKWTTARQRVGRPGVLQEIRDLTVRMARENPTWGYRRMQGALKNLGHRVARSTIAALLRAEGIGPVPERPMSWRTFLAAHWGTIAAADFFTTDVWTAHGLVTYYTLFIMELASRRVQIVSAQPIEFLERHSKLSKDLEEQRRANFPSTMQGDRDGTSITVCPAFVAASLAEPHETERQRHALKLARRRTRHARFRSCPSEALARGPHAPGRLNQIRAGVQPGPPRACPSARSSLREPGSRLPTSHRPGGKGRPCNRQSPWGHYMARGRPTCRTQSDAVRPRRWRGALEG